MRQREAVGRTGATEGFLISRRRWERGNCLKVIFQGLFFEKEILKDVYWGSFGGEKNNSDF